MTYWLGFNDAAKVIAGQRTGDDQPPCFPAGSCWNPDLRKEPDRRRSGFSEEQVIGVLREHDAGANVAEVCLRHGISSATFHSWRAEFGGMDYAEAQRLKALEENAKLRRLYADAMLDNAALRDLLATQGLSGPQEGS